MAPFDREGALKRAEKALRLGRVDAAIEEYQGIVLAQPRDWNSANALGDLFVRSGQLDKGVEQYTRIADHLAEEGFYPKASALYKKILKVKPSEEYALVRSGDVAAKLGLLADAKTAYQTVADRRRKLGNVRGAAEMAVRLGTVDPEDFDARYAAAKAARELGDRETALRELRAAAVGFEEKARLELARSAYRDILELEPEDEDARARVLAANIATGEFTSAFALASSPDELRQLAAALEAAGQHSEMLSVWDRIANLDPADVDARVQVVGGHLAAGDTVAARRHLTPEVAAHDATLWMTLAEAELRAGRFEDGKSAVASALQADPSLREAAIAMACRLAEQSPDSAYPGIEAVADAALAEGDYAAAAAALHEFVTRVRRHIVALMRLVEICVDGGLEATMYSAQAQLADAYLDAGRGLEARIISEDLVAREPWDRANIERFRRALEMLGEADPDAIIADRLSGDSPFMATDKMDLNEGVVFDEPVDVPAAASAKDDGVDVAAELDAPGAEPSGRGAAGQRGKAGKAGRGGDPSGDDAKAYDDDLAAEQLRLAHTYRDMGMIDDAIQSLERAARSSRQRFEAASLLGRLHMERGERSRAARLVRAGRRSAGADCRRRPGLAVRPRRRARARRGIRPGAGRLRRDRRRVDRLPRRRRAHRAPEPRPGPGVDAVPAAPGHRPAHRARAVADRGALVGVLGAQLLLAAVAGAVRRAHEQLRARRHHRARCGERAGGARRPVAARAAAIGVVTRPAAAARPWLIVVSDRRRLCAAAGRPIAEADELLVVQALAAAAGGVAAFQVREPDLEGRALLALVGRLAATGVRVLVNDRADVAAAAGVGVHLRASSMPTESCARVARPAPVDHQVGARSRRAAGGRAGGRGGGGRCPAEPLQARRAPGARLRRAGRARRRLGGPGRRHRRALRAVTGPRSGGVAPPDWPPSVRSCRAPTNRWPAPSRVPSPSCPMACARDGAGSAGRGDSSRTRAASALTRRTRLPGSPWWKWRRSTETGDAPRPSPASPHVPKGATIAGGPATRGLRRGVGRGMQRRSNAGTTFTTGC